MLAAAIAGQVPSIITFNLAHFPETALAPHGIRAIHPDAFASELVDASPEPFVLALRQHRAALSNPRKTIDEYLETLRRATLLQTVERLQAFKEHL